MSTIHMPPNDPYAPDPVPQSSNGLKYVLFSCLGVTLCGLLLCGGLGIYAYMNAGRIAIGFARQAIVGTIESSELSADDKQQVIAQVDRVIDAYKAGKITLQDLEKVGKELENSPLPLLLISYGAKEKYINKSGLSDEEKAAADKILMRFARGGIDKSISQADVEKTMGIICEPGPDGKPRAKESLTDAEIRSFLAQAKKNADDAGVPAEIPAIDVGDEVKRVLDNALGDKLK